MRNNDRIPAPLKPFLSDQSFRLPEYFVPSAWHEHAPFAFWLIEALRPKVLVELGSHRGFSYMAFCEAVARLELKTRCYAIDTWRGDNHTGLYSEDVLTALRSEHDRRYAPFSRLVRATFDEAVGEFSDRSIDLLHVDGRHGYADARHDFETWRPKLSNRAVVLFHDTRVFYRGFGVFRFWNEVSRDFPHFEFVHGHGLGVLGVGRTLAKGTGRLFEADRDSETGDAIRAAYARLGAAIGDRWSGRST